MRLAHDLFMPFRPGRVGLVTSHAMAVIQYLQFYVGVIHMRLARAVTALAGYCLVFVFENLLNVVGVTLVTSLLSRKNWLALANFHQSVPAEPAILLERRRGQTEPRNRI